MNKFNGSLCVIAGCLMAAGAALRAAGEINFAVDIPTTVSAATYQPFQTVNGYAPAAVWSYAVNPGGPGSGLTPGVHVDALAQLPTGAFAFSVDAPALINVTTYHPADILSYSGVSYSKIFDHQTDLGLGEAANLTAIGHDGNYYYIALDAPITVNKTGGGTIAYDPRDLLRVDTTGGAPLYTLVFDGTTGPNALPAGVGIAGAERLSGTGDMLLAFDVPVTLGPVASQPGDILRWNGLAWSLYYRDTAVFPNPPPNLMSDFSLPLTAGEAVGLKLTKSGGNLGMTWSAATCAGGTTTRDYAVYEGTLGAWYSHNAAKTCTTGGLTNATVTPGAASQYYLVVPSNGAVEGNYGFDSSGSPTPRSTAACRPDQKPIAGCA
jgi:hypothetical protein